MIKTILVILFPLCVFAQDINYKSMSDEELQVVLQMELQDMEAKGATPDLIFQKFVIETNKYIMSREAYYRFGVHAEYMVDKLLAMKMENDTEKAGDFEMIKKIKKRKSYQDYLDDKKSDQAKENWENSTQDGILKLVVDNHKQYNAAEQKRYDGLIILLNRDTYFTKLEITDGQTVKEILPQTNQNKP